MLIHYSIAAQEILEHKLSGSEKEDVYDVFYRFGKRMNLQGLPTNFREWQNVRKYDLEHDLEKSKFSIDLYKQYKKHLGAFRYRVLLEGQILVVPEKVKELLNLRSFSFLKPVLPLYKLSRKMRMDGVVKSLILPAQYKKEIEEMDVI